MLYGVHLPIIDLTGESPFTARHIAEYARAAESLGYATLAVTDRLVFPRPFYDGMTALSVAAGHTERVKLATSIIIAPARHPVAMAKAAATLDALSGGRFILGAGPGSLADDHRAVGLNFEERWKRFEECVLAMKALWRREDFKGRYYDIEDVDIAVPNAQTGGPPVYIGSWGSDVGLRRTARLADGWLASAYNTDPPRFAESWRKLRGFLREAGKDADDFPNALSTSYFYITEDPSVRVEMVRGIFAKMLPRPEKDLLRRLLIGSAEQVAERLSAYQAAGLRQVFLWPVRDELQQLETFMTRVASQVESG
jgi:probable F420-dependent oxidoreductase